MGLKEQLIANWEDKTIEYCDKKFYIVKQFEFEGIEYLYAVDIETYDKNPINIVFLHRVKDEIFEHIEDEDLVDELFTYVSQICAAEIVRKKLEEYKDQVL